MAEPLIQNHQIILCTLNAKYIHASLGLRYLLANMKRHGSPDLADETLIVEYTLARQTQQMVEDLLICLLHQLRLGKH